MRIWSNISEEVCAREGIEVRCVQSNHEGTIVDYIQDAYQKVDGIVMNPAAYTHTSVAILDALGRWRCPRWKSIFQIYDREEFRHHSYPAWPA